MKLTDESGKEYEVVGEGLLGPTCAPYTVFTVRPVPTADEVDRLVEDWDRERPGEIDIARAARADLKTRIRALLARQTERQRADEALVEAIIDKYDGGVAEWWNSTDIAYGIDRCRAAREPAREDGAT